MDFLDVEVWVVDTSSLINVKELIKPQRRKDVFDALSEVCDGGRLVFPREVVDELKNGIKGGKPDLPLAITMQGAVVSRRTTEVFSRRAGRVARTGDRMQPPPTS